MSKFYKLGLEQNLCYTYYGAPLGRLRDYSMGAKCTAVKSTGLTTYVERP